MTDFYRFLGHRTSRPDLAREVFGHPADVLDNPSLSRDEMRALLASWASDANAVPHVPSLRQLPDGSIVRLDEIMQALKSLHAAPETMPRQSRLIWLRHRNRSSGKRPEQGRGPDDDDDPPPCPAYAAPRPRGGDGESYALPDAVAA